MTSVEILAPDQRPKISGLANIARRRDLSTRPRFDVFQVGFHREPGMVHGGILPEKQALRFFRYVRLMYFVKHCADTQVNRELISLISERP